jgi:UDP-N-acetylmuramyl pentapeptide phosphotransferase/UDP-N-acetylglucosamine-1-phosphate transferase
VTSPRFLAGAAAAEGLARLLTARPPGGAARWERTNFRGRSVSLLSGPALGLSAGAASTAPGPALVAGVGAVVVGAYDDAIGRYDGVKGVRGHLGALRSGRLTAGGVKLAGLPLVGLVAAAVAGPRRRRHVLLGGAVVAGAANAMNLLDLRPGRALKVGIVASWAVGEPGVAGACAALLPGDLRERTMLGDAGANALGAVLGVAAISRLRSSYSRGAVLLGLAWLTAASERVSFSEVIERTPALRRLDQLGRRS